MQAIRRNRRGDCWKLKFCYQGSQDAFDMTMPIDVRQVLIWINPRTTRMNMRIPIRPAPAVEGGGGALVCDEKLKAQRQFTGSCGA